MNATAIAAALGARAEEVCRRYLPHGRRSGRYWTAGDIRGARGRSLFVRLRPPGIPGKWTDAATAEHGDLLDLIRIASGAGSLRAALAEARAFLSLPAAPVADGPDSYDRSEAARRLWQRCRAIDGTHAEAYLRARALHRCRFPALRFHPSLFYRDGGGVRRLPALVAAVTGATEQCPSHSAITGVHRTWLDPRRPAKASVARPRKALGRVHGLAVRFGTPAGGTLLVGEGIETVLALLTAVSRYAARRFAPAPLALLAPPPCLTPPDQASRPAPVSASSARRLAVLRTACRRRASRAAIVATPIPPHPGTASNAATNLPLAAVFASSSNPSARGISPTVPADGPISSGLPVGRSGRPPGLTTGRRALFRRARLRPARLHGAR